MSERDGGEFDDVRESLNTQLDALREENGRLKSDMRDCLDVLQMCLSDKNMNVSTHGGIVGCINVIQQALAHDASKE